MATGKAPISGTLAIACGLLAATTEIYTLSLHDALPIWNTVVSALTTFAMFVIVWRGMKKQDREYQERLERLKQRLRDE